MQERLIPEGGKYGDRLRISVLSCCFVWVFWFSAGLLREGRAAEQGHQAADEVGGAAGPAGPRPTSREAAPYRSPALSPAKVKTPLQGFPGVARLRRPAGGHPNERESFVAASRRWSRRGLAWGCGQGQDFATALIPTCSVWPLWNRCQVTLSSGRRWPQAGSRHERHPQTNSLFGGGAAGSPWEGHQPPPLVDSLGNGNCGICRRNTMSSSEVMAHKMSVSNPLSPNWL